MMRIKHGLIENDIFPYQILVASEKKYVEGV